MITNDTSQEPQPLPTAVSSGFAKAEMSEVLRAMPREVRELAKMAHQQWGISMNCLAATALAHMADALGNAHQLVTPGFRKPAGFNMIVVGASPEDPGRWIEALGMPWLWSAQRIENDIHKLPNNKYVRPRNDGPAPPPDACFAEVALSADAKEQRPITKIHGSCPDRLRSVMPKSLDRAVTCFNGAYDPVRELFQNGRNAPQELASMLLGSWRQVPLVSDKDKEIHGSVTILWRSAAREIRRFLGTVNRWAGAPPPVLLVLEGGAPKRFPVVATPEFESWSVALGNLFHQRLRPSVPICWHMGSEACKLIEDFGRELCARSSEPGNLGGSMTWMQDLAVSLALILTCSQPGDQQSAGGPQIPVPLVKNALHLTRWLIELHVCALEVINREPEVAVEPRADATEVTDDVVPEEVAKEILEVMRRKGSLTKREISRSFHNLSAKMRDWALHILILEGQVRESSGGRLELTALAAVAC